MNRDIRWRQRFQPYVRAFSRLKAADQLAKTRPLSELEEQGLIKAFEFTFELAWNLMKDILEYQGVTALLGSRDAIRAASSRMGNA